MADELLNAVIQLESQIQQQLDSERSRAASWLAGVRDELEKQDRRAAEERETGYQQALQDAKRQAEEQQNRLLAVELDYCRNLNEINDETLLEVLTRTLVKLLPEPSDDHQNGES